MSISLQFRSGNTVSNLNHMADHAVPEGAKAGLRAIADDVIIGAKNVVPVKTGNLRDSIRILAMGEDFIIVGSNESYAYDVEHGTSKRPATYYLGQQVDKMRTEGAKILSDEVFRRLKGI